MKKTYLILLIIYLFVSPSINAKNNTVSVAVIQSTDKYEITGSYPVLFKVNVAKNWYIHSSTKEEFLIPTELSFTKSEGIKINNILFPETEKKKFEYTSRPVDVYSGSFFVHGKVEIGSKAPIGLQKISGRLSYQACSAVSCLSPEKIPIVLDLRIVPQGSVTTQINRDIFLASQSSNEVNSKFDSGLFWALLVIFLQGLALNLTPCIYPLIPITLSFFGGRSDKTRGNSILSGLIYLSGLAFTNSILGVSAALSGNMLGSALQYPAVLIFIALVMISLAFSFFGFWEFGLPSAFTKLASKNYQGYFGTFFMGLTLGIVAAPCIGPFVLSLLLYVGQKGDPYLGFLYFFILSIGLGFPMCILAIFSGTINRIPKSGDWMLWIRKIFGWILIAMGYYYIRSLISSILLEHSILLCLAVIAGIHLGWVDKTGKNINFFKYIKRGVGCLIIILGMFYMYSAIDLSASVKWVPYSKAVLEDAAKNSKPVVMDVYADWCGPCKLMDKKVFTDPEIIKLSKSFIMTRIDITRKIKDQDEVKEKYGIKGAPTIIFFDKKGTELPALRIESEVGTDEFISHMKKALDK